MPISDPEWESIRIFTTKLIDQLAGRAGSHFFVDKVIKRDADQNLVWVKELGDTPVPIFTFDYEVKYYDESPRGTGLSFGAYKTYTKFAKVKVLCPKIGETVLIAREMGVNRLPRCLGVLRSTGFVTEEEEGD